MSCDGNCSSTETAMFMIQSRKEGYDEGLERGHEDKISHYETQIIGLKDHVERLERKCLLLTLEFRDEIARLKAENERLREKAHAVVERLWQWNQDDVISASTAREIERLLRTEVEG